MNNLSSVERGDVRRSAGGWAQPVRNFLGQLLIGGALGMAALGTQAATAPTVTTGAPSEIVSVSARVVGTVNPNGALTTSYFQYGTTTGYGQIATLSRQSKALDFQGNVIAPGTVNVPLGGSHYTIEAWIKPDSMGDGRIVSWGNLSSSRELNELLVSGTGLINSWWHNDLNANTGSLVGAWHHVAASFDGSIRKIYLDGALVAQDTPGGPSTSEFGGLHIGNWSLSVSRFFDGAIAELRIWNTALSDTTMQSWMNQSIAINHPNYANLTAYFPLNEGAGSSVRDRIGNTDNLVEGNVVWTSGAPLSDLAPESRLKGLLPGTTYHYRLVSSNSVGVTYGANQTFTTPGNVTFNVTNVNDSGAGSLRQALLSANATAQYAIINATGVSGTITLTNPLPAISNSFTFNGPGAANLTISGGSLFRPFFIDVPGGSVTISGVTLANGRAMGGNGGLPSGGGGGGLGGALFVNQGDVTLSGVDFVNNQAVGGNGANAVSATAGGGGGGLGGNGGSGQDGGSGGGGGGFGGNGGAGENSAGGGGGIVGNGGNGGYNGAGGGGTVDGQNGGSLPGNGGGGGGRGGDVDSNFHVGHPDGFPGELYGGGGGAADRANDSSSGDGGKGGAGGKFGGGGGGGEGAGGGNGGEFGGGGGVGWLADSTFARGGHGGFGGGGGSGRVYMHPGYNGLGAYGGMGGFGGGGGGSITWGLDYAAGGGAFGGRGGTGSIESNYKYLGGGGGGAALGGAVFARSDLGATVTFIDVSLDAGSLTVGTGGTPLWDASAGLPGEAHGSAVFLPGTNALFTVNSGTKTIAGTLSDWDQAPGGLTKLGNGSLILSATNNYRGATRVQQGELRVDGRLVNSPMTVTNTGTLSGSGQLASLNLDSGGTVTPGVGIGVLTTGPTAFSGAVSYQWQLMAADRLAGVGYDQWVIQGALNLSNLTTLTVSLQSVTSTNGTAGPAVNFIPGQPYAWVLIKASGGILGFAAEKIQVNTTGLVNSFTPGVFSVRAVQGNLILDYTPNQPPAAPISPTPATLAATGITGFSALLNGSVDAGTSPMVSYFEYGITTAYGQIVPAWALMPVLDFQGGKIQVANPVVPASNSTYTVEAWIKPDSMGDRAVVAWGLTQSNRTTGFRLHGNGLYHYWGSNDLMVDTGSLVGAWHHVAASFDGTTRRIYLDGVQVAQDTPGNNHTVPSSNLWIGSRNDGAGEFFDGKIAEVRIWNTALSQSALQTWMRHSLTVSHPDYAALMGYWPLTEGNGTTLNDHSIYSQQGTLTGVSDWRVDTFLYRQPPAALLRGLTPATTYHYRLVTSNSVGVVYGENQTFTTAAPVTYTVSNLNDSGAGSLRAALLSANADQDRYAYIDATGISGTIYLTNAYPVISNSFTLAGPGTANLTISGSNLFRPFFIDVPLGNVTIQNVTLADGLAKGGSGGQPAGGGGAGLGGAIFVNQGQVTVSNVFFVNNQAIGGAGGNGAGEYAGGGGGGLGGDGGNGGGSYGGGGGGGFLGRGGNGAGAGGAGGGILGRGGNGGNGYGGGGGGGGTIDGQDGGGTYGEGRGGGGRGGDTDTPFNVGQPHAWPGELYGGGGGGAGFGSDQSLSSGGFGGKGGRFGGGGAGGFQRGGADGGEFGGGGGVGDDTASPTRAGTGGFGAGGGGGSEHPGGGALAALGGYGGFGGGGGGAAAWSLYFLSYAPTWGGPFGGHGGAGNGSNTEKHRGGGGGGAALGGAVFVRQEYGASITFIDSSLAGGNVVAGSGGTPVSDASAGQSGQAHGSAVFLPGGTNLFTVTSGSQSIQGSVSDWDLYPAILAKQGSGRLVLGGTNHYRGATLVNAGELRVNGVLINSTAKFPSGTTLSGSGALNGAELVSGVTLAPGDGVGRLTVTNLTLSGAMQYNWQVLTAGGAAGVGYDQMLVNGALNLSNVTSFTINLETLPGNDFSSLNGYSWVILRATGGFLGLDLADFELNLTAANGTAGFTEPYAPGHFQLRVSGNVLVLDFIPNLPPHIAILPASSVTASTATLNASLNLRDPFGGAYFEYGLTTSYGNLATGSTLDFQDNSIAVDAPNVPIGNSPYTVEVWLKPDTMGVKNIVTWGEYGPRNSITELRLDPNGLYFGWWGKDFAVTTGSLVGAWHHVAISYDGTVRRIFLDGAQIAQDTPGETAVVTANNFRIGYSRPGAPQYFDGELAEVRVWATAVNLTNLVAWKDRFLTETHPDYANLKGYWPLSEGSGTQIFDHSGNGNHGTLSGTPHWDGEARFNLVNTDARIGGLLPATTYHYRLVATNSVGITYGDDVSFTTDSAAPYANTLGGDEITPFSARLHADVRSNGEATTVYFNFGTTTNYGSFSSAVGLAEAGIYQAVRLTITNLLPATTYHYQVVASNALGVTVGTNRTFATDIYAPSPTTLAATDIVATGATLNGAMVPNGLPTISYFEYGPTTSFGSTALVTGHDFQNQSVSVPNPEVPTSNSTYTVEAWIKPDSMGDRAIVSWGLVGQVNRVTALRLHNNGLWHYWWGNDLSANTGSLIGAWHHVAASFDGTTRRIYLNGVAVAQDTPGSGHTAPSSNFRIGSWSNGDAEFFDGEIAEVRVWAAAVNVTNLVAWKDRSLNEEHPDYANLKGYWPLNEGSGAAIFDRSGNGQHGTLSGTPHWGVETWSIPAYPRFTISDLLPGETYHYRLVSSNSLGVVYGEAVSFLTASTVPLATTLAATDLDGRSTTLNATVRPNGELTTVYFNYGTTASYGQTTPSLELDTTTGTHTVDIALAGLQVVMPYHFQVVASNSLGVVTGADLTFTTTAAIPSVTTLIANGGQVTNAVLNGTVNPNGAATTVYFHYGETESYGQVLTTNLSAGTVDVPINLLASLLAPATTYHYQLMASNLLGVAYGESLTLTTPSAAPVAATLAVTGLASRSAILQAEVATGGENAWVYFNYGLTTAYGHTTPVLALSHRSGFQAFSSFITNLNLTTTYQYEVVVSNHLGVISGGNRNFTTPALLPTVVALPASDVRSTNAVLNGAVHPGGAATTVYFHYGETESYGQVLTTNLAAGQTELPVSRLTSLLTPALTYHYQLVASNIIGVAYSEALTFTASNGAPAVVTLAATDLAGRSVTLNATANPNGEATKVYFNYGTNTAYGQITAPIEIGSTPGSQSLTLAVTNLIPSTVYHFQAAASNRLGVVTGADLSFVTTEASPTVITLPASQIEVSSAMMNGLVVPNSTNAVSHFEYGLTTNYSGRTMSFGRALDFQDNSIAVDAPNVPIGNSSYTVEVWLKPDTMGIKNIIAWGEYGSRNSITELRLDSNGLYFGWWNNDFSVTTGSLVGAWHHVAISYDGTVRRIFLDGVQIAQNTPGEMATVTANNFRIGYSRPDAPQYFDGELAEVRVWATAVTLTNLVAWKDRFLTETHPDYANLKGYWPLNEGSGANIIDHSGNGNHGTLTGTRHWNGEPRIDPLNPSLMLTGLLPATTYHYRLVATNSLGTTQGEDVAFTTDDAAPYAVTLAADAITALSARLQAEVRPNGEATTVYFNYGTTIGYGLTTPTEVLGGAGDYQSVSRTVSGLLPGVTYHAQVVASNSVGVTYGVDRAFTLPSTLPAAETIAVTDIAGFSAVFNGEINPGGADTTVYFHYGETTDYGYVITTNLPAGNAAVAVSLLATNLALFTDYHVQVVASNSVGVVSGGDLTFATLSAPPTVVSLTHESVTSTNAQLRATVNPNGATTTVYFKYGATADYGQTTAPVIIGDSVEPQLSSAVVAGFLPVTTIHYQVVASNSVGVVISDNASFTTLPVLPIVTTLPATNIASVSAVLTGAVTTNDFNVTSYFEYGTTTNLGTVAQGFSRALNFHYDSSYTSVILANLDNFSEGGVPYTFELWFKPDRMGDQTLFRWSMEGGVALLLTDTGLVHTWGTPEEGVPPLRADTGSLVGQWHHAVASFDGTTRRIYLDGSLVAQDTPAVDFGTLSAWYYEFTLGNDYSYNFPYDGAMMEVRVWAESLALADIRHWMNHSLNATHPRYAQIRAHWRLDTAIVFRGYKFPNQIDEVNRASYYTVQAGSPRNILSPSFIDAPFAVGGYPSTFISGLEPLTTYYHRLTASNTVGVAHGEILSFTTGAASPIAMNLRATDIGSSNVVLRAEILTRGADTAVYFQHGSTANYGHVTTLSNFSHSATAQPITAVVDGLLPGMPYHFQIVASNSVGVVTGKASFAALSVVPTVATLFPTNIAGFHAVLNAQVYSGGADTTVFFHYGTNTAYGQTLVTNIPAGTATLDLSLLAEGLSLFTEYHVQVVASNRVGVVTGEDVVFATLGGIPAVTTMAAGATTTNTAVINGSYDTHGADTIVYFHYGPTTGYGLSSTPVAVGDDLGEQSFQTTLTDLAPGVVYHYQAVASNVFGVTVGADATATTLPMAPTVTTLPVSELKARSAQLNAAVVLNDAEATSYFEYGMTSALGQTASFNRALKLPGYPGYDTYVRTPFDDLTNGAPYTFEAWIKPDTMANQTIFNLGQRLGVRLQLTETGLRHSWSSLAPILTADTGSLTGRWHHVAISYDGTNRFLYLDGDVVAQDAPTGVYQIFTTQFYLGGSRFDQPYNGAVTELRIWGEALDETALRGWINGSLADSHPAYTSLLCYWRLNGGGSIITDESGNDNNGTHYLESGGWEYEGSAAWTGGPVAMGTAPQGTLLGLEPMTTYHYRVVSSNSVATVYGEILSFITPPADPDRTTLLVSDLTSSSATLNALVNANGTNTHVYFNYGATTNYGFTTPLVDIGELVTNQNVSAAISGLTFATIYHVQIVASNALGVFPGNNLTFITLPIPPTVTTLPASEVTKFSAMLNGAVIANGAPTFSHFEYGATTNYGNITHILDKSLDFQAQSIVVTNADVPLGNSPYTIEAWIKPESMGNHTIVAWGSIHQSFKANALRLHGNGLYHYWWDVDIAVDTGSLTGAWHHVAASFDGTTRRLYLDGLQVAQDVPSYTHDTAPGDLRIGSMVTGDNEYFDGQIAEVRVWSTAVIATNLYLWRQQPLNAGHPNYANLKGYWPLSEGLGTNIVDRSTNGNDGTIVGTPHWLADSPFVGSDSELSLTNLLPGNEYHYRLVSSNSVGVAYGADESFTTTYAHARSLGLERPFGRTVKVSVAKLLAMVDDADLDETLSLIGVEETTANGASVYVDGNWVIYQPATGYNDTDTFTFRVSDSRGAVAQGTVTVVIREEDNGQSFNLISVTVQTGGAMQIQAIGLPGRSYTFQATTNLTTPVWVTLGDRTAGANGLFEFTDPDAINHTQRYYRTIPTP